MKIYPRVSSLAVSGYLMHVHTKTVLGIKMQSAHFFLEMPQSMIPLKQRLKKTLHNQTQISYLLPSLHTSTVGSLA